MFPVLLALVGSVQAQDHSALFVGNSYTFQNRPFGLDGSYAQLLSEGMPAWEEVEIHAYTRAGYRLDQHFTDATGGTELDGLLHGSGGVESWTAVILQDQSQVPGFPATESQWQASRDGAVGLAGMVDAMGGKTHLLVTWGRRDGDAANDWLFPDYETMQGHLDNGYAQYAEAIQDAGYNVGLIPAGSGWRAIHDDLVAAGTNPTEGETAFTRLYVGDGSHPSPQGTYLAACIVYGTLTGMSPVGLVWAHETIASDERDALQQIAQRVVFPAGVDTGDSGDAPTADDSDEPASDDSGEPTTGDDDGSPPPDVSDPITESPSSDDTDGKGCSCSASPGSGVAPWFLVLIAMFRRRASGSDPRTSRPPPDA